MNQKLKPVSKKDRRELDANALTSLCRHLANGKSLRSWAKKAGYTASSVHEWLLKDAERNKAYRAARQMQADTHIDQLLELCDTQIEPDKETGRVDPGAVNLLRLKVDTRKWVASKFHPDMYGDRVAVQANVNLSELPPERLFQDMLVLLADNGLAVLPAPAIECHGPDGNQ